MAATYIDQILEGRKQEAECIRLNRQARGADVTAIGEDVLTRGGELAEAIEAYEADMAWEDQQVRNGKGRFTGREHQAELRRALRQKNRLL